MGLLQMSFTGAILILVIVVIRAIAIHRLPKKTFLVLWIIALARLLLPFSVSSPFSVYSLMRGNEPDFQTSNTVVYENRQPMYHVEMEQIQNNPVVSNTTQTLQTAPHISIWTTIWIIGMLIFAGLFLVSYLRCRREFRAALPIQNSIIAEWLDEHQLKRKIEIRQFSEISTPMTYGVIHPVILLPQNSDWKNKQQLQYILFHEYVHICRYDTALKILATIALCIHWFNPMVWVMYILFNRDIELTCDECVIREFGRENRSDYARMLISVEERKNLFAPFCNNFSKNAIEERIVSIMKFRKFSISTAITAIVVVLGIITTFATSAAQNEDENKSVTLSQGNTDISAPDVEWWTYEDYKAWLDNEKIELQEMLGEKGWTGGRGDFIWTQEVIDETIAMYEDILEQIKSGAKISKTVDGSDDIMLMQSTPIDSSNEINNEEIIDKFGSFGISFNDDKMLYNGEEVRLFFDGTEISDGYVTRYVYYNENGTADITTEYEPTTNADGSNDPFGKLVGLRKATEEEFKSVNFGYNSEEITLENENIVIADIFEVDKNVEAIITNYTDEYTIAEDSFAPSGKLVGLKEFSQEEFDSRNIEQIKNPKQEAIAGDPVSDVEINSWITEYGAFGVTYDKSNDQWYFNGERVRRFMDILTSNGEDLSSGKFHGSIRTLNGNGTVDIYTIRDFDNLNSEGNGTLIDVKSYSQKEFDEHTNSSGAMIETP